jgi:hypothetical protein
MTDQSSPTEPPPTVTMEALRAGSYDGFPFQTGDTIDVRAGDVEALQMNGTAVRADRLARADEERAAREAAHKTTSEPKSPVTPRRQ